jgi:hypothetical protein
LCTGLLVAGASVASQAHAEAPTKTNLRSAAPDPNRTRTFIGISSAIIEAQVDHVSYSYDVHFGPRTVVDLRVTNLIAGELATDHLSIAMFGGPRPGGHFVSMSAKVNFAVGRSYVLCLLNFPWFYTPFAAEALRVQSAGGREILVSQSGFAVTGLSPRGLQFSPIRLYPGADPSDLAGADQTAIEGAPAEAIAGALDRQDLIRLLKEGMTIENIAPSGTFTEAPVERENWAITRGTPEPTDEQLQSSTPSPSSTEATGNAPTRETSGPGALSQ